MASPLAWLLVWLGTPSVHARRPATPSVPRVPTIEDVVLDEGFTPTPSQSEMYHPGAVLVPNSRGGHDVVVADCIGVEPAIAIMSQSSIATTLSAGVSARLSAVRGEVHTGIEKRLSFVNPEQRTISLGQLRPTEQCLDEVQNAARLQDLSGAVVLHDVLVAIVQNTVCTKADASGRVIALGEAEAAAYSECVQESDAQVPLGYKALPLDKVLAVVDAPVPVSPISTPASSPAAATSSVQFGSTGGLGVEAKLKEQACTQEAQGLGTAARRARIETAARDAQAKATTAWGQLEGEATACTQLPRGERTACIDAVQRWLAVAREMTIDLPAGVEAVDTDCGRRQPAFAAERTTVAARELSTAESVLKTLLAADPTTSGSSPSQSATSSTLVLSDSQPKESTADRRRAREKRHESMAFLKDILANRSPSGTQKAEMMLRLAELYHEEGRDIALDRKGEANAWFERAATLYGSILTSFPTFARADQAAFFHAATLSELDRRAEAVSLYTKVVRMYPDSAYVPDAYIQLGEHYFHANNAYKALLAYKKASTYKDSKQRAFALYKLGWCYYTIGEFGEAIDAMKRVVAATKKPQSASDTQLQDAALQDLVPFFRAAGEQEAGRTYFRKLRRQDLAAKL